MTGIDNNFKTYEVNQLSTQGLDLETALMAVQTNRASLLEAQLKGQVDAIQARNAQIGKLNELLGALNKAAASFPANANATDTALLSNASEITQAAAAAQVTLPSEIPGNPGSWDVTLLDGTKTNVDAGGKAEAEKYQSLNWAFRSNDYSGKKAVVSITQVTPEVKPTKGQLDSFIQDIKARIDGASNSQQMDMLRLQSLSNKRNEAFEVMTNFIKKMQDSRSSILGNMR